MGQIENRLQKLESIMLTAPRKVIRVLRHESETQAQALMLAGYPLEEENRLIIFRVIVKRAKAKR